MLSRILSIAVALTISVASNSAAAPPLYMIDGPRGGSHARSLIRLAHEIDPTLRIRHFDGTAPNSYARRDRRIAYAVTVAGREGARIVNVSMGKTIHTPRTCKQIRRFPETTYVIAAGLWPGLCAAENIFTVGLPGAAADAVVDAPSLSEATMTVSARKASRQV